MERSYCACVRQRKRDPVTHGHCLMATTDRCYVFVSALTQKIVADIRSVSLYLFGFFKSISFPRQEVFKEKESFEKCQK